MNNYLNKSNDWHLNQACQYLDNKNYPMWNYHMDVIDLQTKLKRVATKEERAKLFSIVKKIAEVKNSSLQRKK